MGNLGCAVQRNNGNLQAKSPPLDFILDEKRRPATRWRGIEEQADLCQYRLRDRAVEALADEDIAKCFSQMWIHFIF